MSHRELTALVTGAAGGIGQEIVRVLVERSWSVIASDIDSDGVGAICAETGATPFGLDITDEESVRAVGSFVLNGLVNCAGVGGESAGVVDVDAAVFDRTIAVNARGTLLVMKHVARGMARRGRGGSIVNVSSQASLIGLRGHAVYGASKAAVDSITRNSALELGQHGIRVNSVNPTAVLTQMAEGYWNRPEIAEPFLAAMPLGRWATPREIATPVAFLLSDDAAMITGVSLPIDGGFTIQ
jgi:NAD(P)-dependent dehydrogenase (short-subunit alcohol dehydrogenase family)